MDRQLSTPKVKGRAGAQCLLLTRQGLLSSQPTPQGRDSLPQLPDATFVPALERENALILLQACMQTIAPCAESTAVTASQPARLQIRSAV